MAMEPFDFAAADARENKDGEISTRLMALLIFTMDEANPEDRMKHMFLCLRSLLKDEKLITLCACGTPYKWADCVDKLKSTVRHAENQMEDVDFASIWLQSSDQMSSTWRMKHKMSASRLVKWMEVLRTENALYAHNGADAIHRRMAAAFVGTYIFARMAIFDCENSGCALSECMSSGAKMSTVANLLSFFYDPHEASKMFKLETRDKAFQFASEWSETMKGMSLVVPESSVATVPWNGIYWPKGGNPWSLSLNSNMWGNLITKGTRDGVVEALYFVHVPTVKESCLHSLVCDFFMRTKEAKSLSLGCIPISQGGACTYYALALMAEACAKSVYDVPSLKNFIDDPRRVLTVLKSLSNEGFQEGWAKDDQERFAKGLVELEKQSSVSEFALTDSELWLDCNDAAKNYNALYISVSLTSVDEKDVDSDLVLESSDQGSSTSGSWFRMNISFLSNAGGFHIPPVALLFSQVNYNGGNAGTNVGSAGGKRKRTDKKGKAKEDYSSASGHTSVVINLDHSVAP